MLWQPALPDQYTSMTDAELADGIRERKARLGDQLVILGHHYQQDDVVTHADFTGDSFKLSQLAAKKVTETAADTWFSAACTSWPSRPTSSPLRMWW
jgi:quinolinate synthase